MLLPLPAACLQSITSSEQAGCLHSWPRLQHVGVPLIAYLSQGRSLHLAAPCSILNFPHLYRTVVIARCTPILQSVGCSLCWAAACSRSGTAQIEFSIQEHWEKFIKKKKKGKDGMSHTNKNFCYPFLVSILLSLSRVLLSLTTPASTWNSSTEANWPHTPLAKAAKGRQVTQRQPKVWKSPINVSPFLLLPR